MTDGGRSFATRSLPRLLPLGLAIGAGVLALSPIRDADFFWHIANERDTSK